MLTGKAVRGVLEMCVYIPFHKMPGYYRSQVLLFLVEVPSLGYTWHGLCLCDQHFPLFHANVRRERKREKRLFTSSILPFFPRRSTQKPQVANIHICKVIYDSTTRQIATCNLDLLELVAERENQVQHGIECQEGFHVLGITHRRGLVGVNVAESGPDPGCRDNFGDVLVIVPFEEFGLCESVFACG